MLPSSYRDKELKIRKLLSTALLEAKLTVLYLWNIPVQKRLANINTEVVKKYYHELQIIAKELDNNDELMSTVMRMPEV